MEGISIVKYFLRIVLRTYSFTIILNTSLSFSQIRKSAKFRKMNEGANGTLNYSSKFAGKVVLYQYQFILLFQNLLAGLIKLYKIFSFIFQKTLK